MYTSTEYEYDNQFFELPFEQKITVLFLTVSIPAARYKLFQTGSHYPSTIRTDQYNPEISHMHPVAIQNFIKDIIKKLAIPYIEQGFTPTFILQKSVNF